MKKVGFLVKSDNITVVDINECVSTIDLKIKKVPVFAVRGKVTDCDGAVIPGAFVCVRWVYNTEAGIQDIIVGCNYTNGLGEYLISVDAEDATGSPMLYEYWGGSFYVETSLSCGAPTVFACPVSNG